MFAVLVIALISSVILAVIFWPQIQKWESTRFAACSPCGDEVVKIEALNYLTALMADQNVFEGVRIRLCNCRAEKALLTNARIRYKVELPDGTPKCSKSYLLPKGKDGSGPLIPALEPQEGAKFDWYEMAPEADKVLISRPNCDPTQTPNLEESASGRVTLELLLDGKRESDYVWQVFYAPICSGTCKSKFGGYYCQPGETDLGVLNCETDERCCK